jgi:hypothetical protein
MLDAPATPVWILLTVPVITALATWATTKFEVLSLRRVREYEGLWYAYYLDPDTRKPQEELWNFSVIGRVTVTRNGKITFKGVLTVKGNKAYMDVKSTLSEYERLFVMLDSPTNPHTGDSRSSPCIWVGMNGNGATTAGHGLLSRIRLQSLDQLLKDEFLQVVVAPPARPTDLDSHP